MEGAIVGRLGHCGNRKSRNRTERDRENRALGLRTEHLMIMRAEMEKT